MIPKARAAELANLASERDALPVLLMKSDLLLFALKYKN